MSKTNEIADYQKYLQRSKSCSHCWRILGRRPEHKKRFTKTDPHFKVVPVRCCTKVCPYCNGLEVRKIRAKLHKSILPSQIRFFTLTTLNDPTDEETKLNHLVKSFRKLTLQLRRIYPSLCYFYIIERSPSGMWHIHGLWNIYIDLKELSSMWKRYSKAYRCNLQKVRNKRGVINYIASYLTKSGVNLTEKKTFFLTNKRQYNSSRAFFQKENYVSKWCLMCHDYLTTEELKKKLVEIGEKFKFFAGDILFENYPYSEDLLEFVQQTIWLE